MPPPAANQVLRRGHWGKIWGVATKGRMRRRRRFLEGAENLEDAATLGQRNRRDARFWGDWILGLGKGIFAFPIMPVG